MKRAALIPASLSLMRISVLIWEASVSALHGSTAGNCLTAPERIARGGQRALVIKRFRR